tara:strand:- start:1108 stop:1293 length:186 start_codon:yes stop_codon:yes gene_type:complete
MSDATIQHLEKVISEKINEIQVLNDENDLLRDQIDSLRAELGEITQANHDKPVDGPVDSPL